MVKQHLNDEQKQAVLEMTMTTEYSAVRIAKEIGFPFQYIYLQRNIDEKFNDDYARAKEAQMELMEASLLDIADDKSGDVKLSEHGVKSCDTEFVQRSRLRVDTRKWLMSKLAPKKYGDRVVNEHQGKDGGAIEMKITKEIIGSENIK